MPETALEDLRFTADVLEERMRIAAENQHPTEFPPFAVTVTSRDLRNRDVVTVTERIARVGRKFGLSARVAADDDTLASYGGSEPLRAYCLAQREQTSR